MHKSRRITALSVAVLVILSLFSCFAYAADDLSSLPDGYIVVNSAWDGMDRLEHFTYVLGGETYQLEYGTTAAASIAEAIAFPTSDGVEKTVVLAPGTYSTAITLNTNIRLCGPYFEKNPNNNPKDAQYDPSLEDWAVNNGRSLDPTKEAVFTANISIANGCTNVKLDGLAFTAGALITDTSVTDQQIRMDYELNNLYFANSTGAKQINFRNSQTKLNRYITMNNCRFENCMSTTNAIDYRAELLEVRGCYMYNVGNGTGNMQFYLYTISPTMVLTADTTARNTFVNNYFELTSGTNFINFADRNSANAGVTDRTRMILEVIDNTFVNAAYNGSGARVIQDQIDGYNQEVTVTGNRFIMNKVSSANAVNVYVNDSVTATAHTKVDISKNFFEGYSSPITGNAKAKLSTGVGPNLFSDGKGNLSAGTPANANTVYTAGEVYNSTLQYASTDFDILNSSIGSVSTSGTGNTRTATLYYVKNGVPTFTFRGKDVSYAVYSDSACTKPLDSSFTVANGTKIYVTATEGSYKCTYVITLSSSKSSLRGLYKYGNAEIANSTLGYYKIFIDDTASDKGYYELPKESDINVSTGATCEVYMSSDLVGNPVKRISLKEGLTEAYMKVTAPNGSYDVYNMYIFGHQADVVDDTLSGDCELNKITVSGAEVIGDDTFGFVIMAKAGLKSIKPRLNVSNKATYKFYMDSACKYEASTTSVVKLNAAITYFYVKVIAENGNESEAIPVAVYSERPVVAYSDRAKFPSYAKAAIDEINESGLGIFAGDEKARFNPNKNITRYELAKVIVNLLGVNVDMAESVKLDEVYDDFGAIQVEASWAIPYIRAAYATGVIKGVSDGKGNVNFAGSDGTTREQFVTVIMRSVASELDLTVDQLYNMLKKEADAAFKDIAFADSNKISSWALKSVKLATLLDLVHGDGYRFNPKNNIRRADVAVVIHNMMDV